MSYVVGLIVNPIAGMGGSVGLKGTDGEMAERARELGAEPVTPDRTAAFLSHLDHRDDLRWLAAPGPMGAAYLEAVVESVRVVGDLHAERTTPEDTRRIARAMVEAGAELLVFVGGDGTARDILDAVGTEVPVVGVPAGVKVYSGAFALSPRAAAEMVDAFTEGAFSEGVDLTEAEVLDIDEDAFRDDRLDAQHYGFLLVPSVPGHLQPSKEGSGRSLDTLENKREIAAAVIEDMDPAVLYLLGPGTTVKAIADELGIDRTLLGIDAVRDRALVAADLNERQILDLLDDHPEREIIVTPLGGNGFIFGRGNKPFTPAVIRAVGPDHITVVATEQKIRDVGVLRVDTGDPEVDARLSGYRQVIIGYHMARAVRVRAES
ncbi:MAG: ATP-NAD kinase family protein [Anaerolineae bacterium]